MGEFNITDHPHRRYNALTGEWILVSPHRAKRPWQGQLEKSNEEPKTEFDPKCYLCPGNERACGEKNPDYTHTLSFINDFSALITSIPEGSYNDGDLIKAESEKGICKVICFSPKHNLTIPEMDVLDITKVIDLWCDEFKELGKKEYINYIQIFENKGSVMGCSNPHPHGQIWCSKQIPEEIKKEINSQSLHFKNNQRTLLSDYLKKELELKVRLLAENDHFVALIPFWAIWPFESIIISRRPISDLPGLSDMERFSLAEIYKQLTVMYDNLFETSFPYSAGIHQSPTDGKDHPHWHFHMHFYPPLLRSSVIKKFMVGYEMLASPQRDITAENAAEKLRSLSKIHYKSV